MRAFADEPRETICSIRFGQPQAQGDVGSFCPDGLRQRADRGCDNRKRFALPLTHEFHADSVASSASRTNPSVGLRMTRRSSGVGQIRARRAAVRCLNRQEATSARAWTATTALADVPELSRDLVGCSPNSADQSRSGRLGHRGSRAGMHQAKDTHNRYIWSGLRAGL